jgi:hypothetical protein
MSDSSFSQDPQIPEAPRKSGGSWLLIVLGVLVGGGVLCCLCCGGLMMMGWGQIGKVVKANIESDPVVQEQLGEIESAKMNLTKATQYLQENPGKNIMAFDIKGSKGSGVVYVEQTPGGKIILKTDSGEYELETAWQQ